MSAPCQGCADAAVPSTWCSADENEKRYFSSGRYDDAMKIFRESYRLSPSAEVANHIGRVCFKRRDHARALQIGNLSFSHCCTASAGAFTVRVPVDGAQRLRPGVFGRTVLPVAGAPPRRG